MKSLMFTGIAASAMIAATPAIAATDSTASADSSAVKSAIEGTMHGAKKHHAMRAMRMGHGVRNHKVRGHALRNRGFGGGFVGIYRRPSYGFVLPTYWRAPSFGIANYNSFGLSAPINGYQWSRYYDDAVLRNNAGTVYDYRQNVDWSQGGAQYAPNGYYNQAQPAGAPVMQADRAVYGVNNEPYQAPVPNGSSQRGQYDGEWTGQYIDDDGRTYRGEWDGQYTNDQGQVYQGTYRGTSVGDPVYTRSGPRPVAPAPAAPVQQYTPAPVAAPQYAPAPSYPQQAGYAPAPAQGYQTPAGYDRYERCLKGRGIAGGAIGGIIGAVAGNRIAGRGNRLAGSLIGGGVGAIGGALIEKAANDCRKYLPQVRQPVAQPQYRQQHRGYRQQPQGYGWSHGYYYVPGGYYYPPAQTVVTVTPGQATTTTTVTEHYEDVYTAPAGKRLVKPSHKRLRKPGY